MPQTIVEKNGVRKLHIYVQVSCKDYPNGRIQLRRVFEDVEKDSSKANSLEREILREAERERAKREVDGTNWETLLSLYDIYAGDKLAKNEWCQSRQTYHEAIRALHKRTQHWY